MPNQLNSIQEPLNRVAKLPIGRGLFRLFNAKSADGELLLSQPGAKDIHRIVAS